MGTEKADPSWSGTSTYKFCSGTGLKSENYELNSIACQKIRDSESISIDCKGIRDLDFHFDEAPRGVTIEAVIGNHMFPVTGDMRGHGHQTI